MPYLQAPRTCRCISVNDGLNPPVCRRGGYGKVSASVQFEEPKRLQKLADILIIGMLFSLVIYLWLCIWLSVLHLLLPANHKGYISILVGLSVRPSVRPTFYQYIRLSVCLSCLPVFSVRRSVWLATLRENAWNFQGSSNIAQGIISEDISDKEFCLFFRRGGIRVC